jgi:hypothetical protein
VHIPDSGPILRLFGGLRPTSTTIAPRSQIRLTACRPGLNMIIFKDFEAREGATCVTLLESFRSAFNNFDPKWVPTDREQKIFQAASESHYDENSIEAIFFQFGGGWTGIIGLVLAFPTCDKQHWQTMGLSEAKELAREVSKLASAQVKKLMDDFGRQRSAYFYAGKDRC